ncbi:replication protein [Zooshikella sp. RANM57]|uniref:replication protein n=1 Tax=Zooshikella sp. RANM57 TaxID=3425863 RepID=UPI003D6E8930
MSIVSFPVVSTVTHESQDKIADIKNGFAMVALELLEATSAVKISGRQHNIINAVIRKTIGFKRQFDRITANQIAQLIDYDGDLSHIYADLRALKARKILINEGKAIGINLNLSEWDNKKSVGETSRKTLNKQKTATNKKVAETCYKTSEKVPQKLAENRQQQNIKYNNPKYNITPLNPPKGQTNKKSKPAKPKREKSTTIDLSNLPDCISEEAAKSFIEHRKAMKAPLTQRAFELAIAEALKGPEIGITPEQALDETMLAGWKGVKIGWLQRRLCTLQRGGQQQATSGQSNWIDDLGDF